jgi:antitoxin YefM
MEIKMDIVSYTSLRQNLAGILDKVNQDRTPILVTRQNGDSAVVMSLKDFQSYEETAHLMASPKNAQRLNESITQIESGKKIERALVSSE